MTRRVKLAVIGTGRMGSVHARNIVRRIPEAELVALCDIRLEVAQTVADELGIRKVVKDYHDLLDDKEIEAVLIAATTTAHDTIMYRFSIGGQTDFLRKTAGARTGEGRRDPRPGDEAPGGGPAGG